MILNLYKKKEYILKINKKIRLDYLIVLLLKKYSRSFIQKLIILNLVLVDGKTINHNDFKIFGLHNLTIYIKNYSFTNKICSKKIYFNIIYEDNDILIIDKPINLVVHSGCINKNITLLNGLIYLYPKNIFLSRAGIVHRLDKNASGLLIIAKHRKMQSYLINLFKYHKIVREYQVLVYGAIKKNEGIINIPLGVHKKYPMRRSVRWDNKGKPATTKFIVQETFNKFTRLLVKLYTGRTHQIRVHMAYIQHPVVGDFIYGGKINNIFFKKKINNYHFNRLALQATKIGFYHITYNKYMEWEMHLSNDISYLIEYIKKYSL